ncbi:MAG: c-type cytochrome [Halieaceae bacterium]|jgi:cytochrome c2|nr:c-type cytochrome [Halieaceae bacterium]
MHIHIPGGIRRAAAVLALGVLGSAFHSSALATELTLSRERTSDTDLEVFGLLQGLAAGESGFIAHADLLTLPTETLSLKVDFYLEPSFEVTVVFMDDVLAALPLAEGADTALMHCRDGYLSIFTDSFRRDYRPFFVLQIEGSNPEDWPETLNEQYLGPYFVSVSETLTPAYTDLFDGWSKRPWGAYALEVVNYQDEYAPVYEGAFARLSESAQQGRDMYLNNCMSCHQWEDGHFGGTTSNRVFPVLASTAVYNNDYFRSFVRNPSRYMKGVYMPAHAHYTDADFEKLTDFLSVYFDGK